MIVPMKKVTLLCLADDTNATLDALRDLGIIHLRHVRDPGSDDLVRLREEHARATLALNTLIPYIPAETGSNGNTAVTPEAVIAEVDQLISTRRKAEEQLGLLSDEKAASEPLGDFDPQIIRELREKGIVLKLYQVRDKTTPTPPDNADIFTLSEGAHGRYVAVVSSDEFEFPAREIPLPERRLSEIYTEIREINSALADTDDRLAELAALRNTVAGAVEEIEERIRYTEARDGMADEGKIAYLQGFCPAGKVYRLRSAADEHGWGLVTEDPASDENVPTLIRTPAWVQPIKALFEGIQILPGYREIDASAAFLLFFSIFFGILVGDAGYGAVFLILTLVGRKKFPNVPSYPFWLLGILSGCTIVWGVITGNYFGCGIPALDKLAKIPWLTDERNLFIFCFLTGAIHLTVAHAWRGLVAGKSTRALAQLGWIALTWCMFFGAKYLVLDEPGPKWMLYVFVLGIVMILSDIIARFREEWMALTTLFFDVIGNFVDVVSYIRLYAVGMASLAVAQAFNALALGSDGRLSGGLATLGAVLILFAGHALNMLLCLMSVLVHGVRLNTLEFSGHIGLEWGGFPYEPFEKKTEQKLRTN